MITPFERWPRAEYADPDTGARVTRLTPRETLCAKPYFYQRSFFADGSAALVCADSGGEMGLWILDLADGMARRVVAGSGVSAMGAFLTADDRFAGFVRGRRELARASLETGKEETLYRVPDGWLAYGTWSPNSACSKVAAIEILEGDLDVGPASGWERFRLLFQRRPRMRLLSIDLASGASRVLADERRFIGHPMYRPFDDATVGFCHEGPHDLVTDRLWLVDASEPVSPQASSLASSVPRPVYAQGAGEACMHEFWVPDGSRLAWVRYAKGERERAIMAARVDSLSGSIACERVMDIPACAHLMSNRDGSRFVGDGAAQMGDVEDPDSFPFESDPYIYLFESATRGITRVCRHDSSCAPVRGNTQLNHPHPCFTPNEAAIAFVSDRDGATGVYLAELPR